MKNKSFIGSLCKRPIQWKKKSERVTAYVLFICGQAMMPVGPQAELQ